ncbi:unnamed protein product [Camellia sinensis]
MDEHTEIQALLINEEEDAMEKARTALQQLVKIQQLKLEAVARTAVSDNHQSDKLPEVYQQTQELKEIDNELFDVVMLMRLYHY